MLIDGKPFFEIPVKNKEEAYEQIIEMGKNNHYTTGNLLDYQYFKDHYQLIVIDLSKQIELENPDLRAIANSIYLEWDHGAPAIFMVLTYVLRFIEVTPQPKF